MGVSPLRQTGSGSTFQSFLLRLRLAQATVKKDFHCDPSRTEHSSARQSFGEDAFLLRLRQAQATVKKIEEDLSANKPLARTKEAPKEIVSLHLPSDFKIYHTES